MDRGRVTRDIECDVNESEFDNEYDDVNENEFDDECHDERCRDIIYKAKILANIHYPYHFPPNYQSEHIVHSHSLNLYNFSL